MAHKVYINVPVEYIMGYLRYGHYEGEIELTDEEFEIFKENPDEAFDDLDLRNSLGLYVDDYRIEDIGNIARVDWNEVK